MLVCGARNFLYCGAMIALLHLLAQANSNPGHNPEFEAQLRTFFMVLALVALVTMWLWLYFRTRERRAERAAIEGGADESEPAGEDDETRKKPD